MRRSDTRIVLACAVLSIALPLLAVRWVPFVDYPEHVAAVAEISRIGDPIFARYYRLALGQSQYLGFYLPAAALARLFGPEVACRIVLVAGLAGLPLAVAAYLAAHRRSVLPAAASACVAFNPYCLWGFVNYEISITAGILALAVHAHLVRRPRAKTAALFGALAVLCVYCHVYLYAWLAVAAILQSLAMAKAVGLRRSKRAAAQGLFAAVPSAAALLAWLYTSRVLQRGEAGDRIIGLAERAATASATFVPPTAMVKSWFAHSFDVYRDGSAWTVAAAFFTVIALSFAARLALSSGPRGIRRTGAPELVLAFSAACYLFGPASYKLVDMINERFLIVVFALLPVLGPLGLRPTRWRTALAAAVVAACACAAAIHVVHFRAIDEEMGDLGEALARTAPGKRLLGLIFSPGSHFAHLPMFLHAHQYYPAHVGGMAAWGFVELAHSPILYQPDAAPPPFPARFEWQPQLFDYRRWGSSFDYFLVRTPPGSPPPRLVRTPEDPTRLAYDGWRWKLYENMGTRP